jgi:hypothetical protein
VIHASVVPNQFVILYKLRMAISSGFNDYENALARKYLSCMRYSFRFDVGQHMKIQAKEQHVFI